MTCGMCESTACPLEGGPPDAWEVHISVPPSAPEIFSQAMTQVGLRSTLVEFQEGRQMMATASVRGEPDVAIRAMWLADETVRRAGFETVRRKLETTCNNPLVPTSLNRRRFGSTYLESHFRVIVGDDEEDIRRLRILAGKLGYRVSSVNSREGRRFVTSRVRLPLDEIQGHLKYAMYLINTCFPVEKSILEYCIFDDNTQMDEVWK